MLDHAENRRLDSVQHSCKSDVNFRFSVFCLHFRHRARGGDCTAERDDASGSPTVRRLIKLDDVELP